VSLHGHQEALELLVNARPDGSGGVVLLFQQSRRDDHVRVDAPKRRGYADGHHRLVTLGGAERILVADHEGRRQLLAERQEPVLRVGAENEADSTPGQVGGDIAQPVDEKRVLA
jgi:hypothetical protein